MNNTSLDKLRSFFWNHKKILGFVLFLLFVVWYLSCHAILKITVERTDQDQSNPTVITITDVDGGLTTIETKSKSIWRIVRSGKYEVSAMAQNESSWTSVDSARFLTRKDVSLHLQKQSNREFTGNNPLGCTYLHDDTLLSYECSGPISSLKIHTKATPTVPTYTKNLQSPPPGYLLGVIHEDSKTRIITSTGDEMQTPVIYDIDIESGALSQYMVINEFSDDASLDVLRYGDGYLIYSIPSKRAVYYHNGKTNKIDLPESTDADLRLARLTTSGDKTVGIFSNETQDIVDGPTEKENLSEEKNSVIISDRGNSQEIIIENPIVDAILCGKEKLCVLSAVSEATNRLLVYDLSKKPSVQYMVHGVGSIRSSAGNDILLIKNDELWKMDADKRTAYVSYRTPGYDICGLGGELNVEGDYICARSGQQSFALRLGYGIDNTIDSKILELSKNPDIERASAYKNLIYLTPKLTLHQTSQGFEYNPKEKTAAAEKLQQITDQQGIDSGVYTIINLRD